MDNHVTEEEVQKLKDSINENNNNFDEENDKEEEELEDEQGGNIIQDNNKSNIMSDDNNNQTTDSNTSTAPPPTDAMMELLAPDGYYTYLGISKTGEVDPDVIKKNYRKLSLKHHPDKRGGDADTFRLLNRAQKVLTTPKLRQQYDNLGLDLDDDDDQAMTSTANSTTEGGSGGSGNASSTSGEDDEQTTSQGIVHEIASMALTTVLQLGVRTFMMGCVSVIVVRYLWTLLPALGFLAFIAYRIYSIAPTGSFDLVSPFIIGIGLVLMHKSYDADGWLTFWIGESTVIGMFTYNSMATMEKSPALLLGIFGFSSIAALWFRGKFWNYIIVLGLELFLAIFIAMAFPIMEMVLEAILADKLRKVGDKVRAHHQYMEKYYNSKR